MLGTGYQGESFRPQHQIPNTLFGRYTLETPWSFDDPPNTAVFTTGKVLNENHPILLVTHDEDGSWQFLCGTTNASEDARIVSLSNILKRDPGLAELANLPYGWLAWRASPNAPWQREVNPKDDEEDSGESEE